MELDRRVQWSSAGRHGGGSIRAVVLSHRIAFGTIALLFVSIVLPPMPGMRSCRAEEMEMEEERIQSGLQVGQYASPFYVKDVTGPAAGKTLCYFCRYADRPVVSVFVRRLDDDVQKLIADVERKVVEHRNRRLAAFIVYLPPKPADAPNALRMLAADQNIRRTPLTIYQDSAEKLTRSFQIAESADVTVMMWKRGEVRANFAYGDMPLAEDEVGEIVKQAESLVKTK